MLRASVGTVLIAVTLAGCAGGGSGSFDWQKASQIKIGMSEAELEAIMGPPSAVRTQGDAKAWVWTDGNGLKQWRVVSVGVKDGKVISVPNTQ